MARRFRGHVRAHTYSDFTSPLHHDLRLQFTRVRDTITVGCRQSIVGRPVGSGFRPLAG